MMSENIQFNVWYEHAGFNREESQKYLSLFSFIMEELYNKSFMLKYALNNIFMHIFVSCKFYEI